VRRAAQVTLHYAFHTWHTAQYSTVLIVITERYTLHHAATACLISLSSRGPKTAATAHLVLVTLVTPGTRTSDVHIIYWIVDFICKYTDSNAGLCNDESGSNCHSRGIGIYLAMLTTLLDSQVCCVIYNDLSPRLDPVSPLFWVLSATPRCLKASLHDWHSYSSPWLPTILHTTSLPPVPITTALLGCLLPPPSRILRHPMSGFMLTPNHWAEEPLQPRQVAIC
jgi:hypothetical protein